MALTPSEKALVFIRDLPEASANGNDIDLEWWNAYLVILDKVAQEYGRPDRKAPAQAVAAGGPKPSAEESALRKA